MLPAPVIVSQHATDHGSAYQYDMPSLMLRGRMPSQLRWVSDGLVRSLTQTIVDLAGVLQSYSASAAPRTLQSCENTSYWSVGGAALNVPE